MSSIRAAVFTPPRARGPGRPRDLNTQICDVDSKGLCDENNFYAADCMLLAPAVCRKHLFGQMYTVTDLGTLSPLGINVSGQVVGNLNGHAYLWTETNGLQDLGTLADGTFSSAAAINDLGVVTGTADGPGTVVMNRYGGYPNIECSSLIQPFIWTQQMQGLGTVGPASDQWQAFGPAFSCTFPFYGSAINNRNDIAGQTGYLPNLFGWNFLWTSTGGMSLFGSSFPPTFANGINNTDQIVGADANSQYGWAVSWKDGVETVLGSLVTSSLHVPSAANGVNDLGQVVGWSTYSPIYFDCFGGNVSAYPMHAVLWKGNVAITDLGALPGDSASVAYKINSFGAVVGAFGKWRCLSEYRAR